MDTSVKSIPKVGKVYFNRSKRYKRLSIRVFPTNKIRVNIPFGYSQSDAEGFVKKNSRWILKKKQKNKNQSIYSPFDVNTNFKTYYRKLFIQEVNSDGYNINIRVTGDKIEIFVPKHIDMYAISTQNIIKRILIEVLRDEAKHLLPHKTHQFAVAHNFRYNKLFIKNIKSRWGSCSKKNNINLSIYLILLPEHLIEYVILHELCHTKIKNHSKEFWSLLGEVLKQDPKLPNNEIKNYTFLPYNFS